MPKAEYFSYEEARVIAHGLEELQDSLENALIALRSGQRQELYNSLNDVCGILQEASGEFGYFHQVLEEYF